MMKVVTLNLQRLSLQISDDTNGEVLHDESTVDENEKVATLCFR